MYNVQSIVENVDDFDFVEIVFQLVLVLIWRIIGGVFDFYMFMGFSLLEVVQQYIEVIGRSFMFSYWSFGFYLCKYGYYLVNEIMVVVKRMQEVKIFQVCLC